jgi:hypothetical protein
MGVMTTGSVISEKLRRRSVVPVECTIPAELTIEQWRRGRCRRPAPTRDARVARLPSSLVTHGLALRDAA